MESKQVGTVPAAPAPREHAAPAGPSLPPLPTAPAISMPKGGGAIRGMGEKFAANPATGTGSFTVPLPLSPGRDGFGPSLALAYDSGHGNGPFGFGWGLSVPSITRKTDKGLPTYTDEDVFLLSDAEDLVPVHDPDADWARTTRTEAGWTVDRFRPRIEGLFARIERWTADSGDVHWRSTTRDNITTVYGLDSASRVHDPADPSRVYSWLICQTWDAKGNAAVWSYLPEDGTGAPVGQVHERHRTGAGRGAHRHLKSVRYGNRVSTLVQPDLSAQDWLFEVVFDYGEHDADRPTPGDTGDWTCRHDPFSSYRPGFEVRQYRLCRRVLMFHHFPDEPGVGRDCLVRSVELTYQGPAGTAAPADAATRGAPLGTFLARATQHGHRREGTGYLTRSLPPVTLGYSQAVLDAPIREADPDSLAGVPAAPEQAGLRWADLDGEGLSGLLAEAPGGWWYKHNLGGGRFDRPVPVATLPSPAGLGTRRLLDLAGDGTQDVVEFGGPTPGFFEREGGGWAAWRPFARLPRVDWNDPNLRFVDLDGDGRADVLITDADVYTWYPAEGEDGFGAARRAYTAPDEDRGPRVVFADRTQQVLLADMSGDGLTDLVRVRNGEVSYWPNLGYGRFGARVVMDGSPLLDHPDLFDHRRVRLADVDGSGVTDLLYLGRDGVTVHLNECGNGFAPARKLTALPVADGALADVAAMDLLGTGTACLVWTSALPADARRPLRYLDLTGGVKPHLLVEMANGTGAVTRVHYTASTAFYLADRLAGRPWVTRLPFPVQVVDRVEVHDLIGRQVFTNRYAYHHGHFDGAEREFRGFGMVEQWDTEGSSATVVAADGLPLVAPPPVYTRTWYHTGCWTEGETVSAQFAHEYWREGDPGEPDAPGQPDDRFAALLLPDTVLAGGVLHPGGARTARTWTTGETREACRALKGSLLRQEVYALDGTAAQDRPYTVSERDYTVELLQPVLPGTRHAVLLAHAREAVTFHYERALYPVAQGAQTVLRADPRVAHELTLAVDGFGNVLRSAAVAYPRRYRAPEPPAGGAALPEHARAALRDEQARVHVNAVEQQLTDPVDSPAAWRGPVGYQVRSYEIGNAVPAAAGAHVTNLFRFDELAALLAAVGDGAHDLPLTDVDGAGAAPGVPWRRLVEHSRLLYRTDDFTAPLPLGKAGVLALPYEAYKLALTDALLDDVYRRERPGGAVEQLVPTDPAARAALLSAEAGYVRGADRVAAGLFPATDPAGLWWSPSGHIGYSPAATDTPAQELAYAKSHFFRPPRFTDPFGNPHSVSYDGYSLLLRQTEDALGNRVTAGVRAPDDTLTGTGLDYRTLLPVLLMDANRNRSAALYDALGLVTAVAAMGKPETAEGDSLTGLVADPPPAQILAHLTDPFADPHALLGDATSRFLYDTGAFARTAADPQPQPSVACTIVRQTHTSELAPGEQSPVRQSLAYTDGLGRAIQSKGQAEAGPVGPDAVYSTRRWTGTGWAILNQKGLAVREYEPFFSTHHRFEYAPVTGVSHVLCHDPLGRVTARLHPHAAYEKVVFDPWRSATWDGNDTVLLDPRTDPDTAGVLGPYLAAVPGWQTWHARRAAGALGTRAQAAAVQTEQHAATPAVAHLDPLGRAFLSVTHNRYTRPDASTAEELHPVRTVFDGDGNRRAVIDPLGRTVVRRRFDLHASVLRVASAEAGETLSVLACDGKALRGWDDRDHAVTRTYDALRRPLAVYTATGGGPRALSELTVYGEHHPQARERNLRTRWHLHLDQAGMVVGERNDFSGSALRATRRLVADHRAEPDWTPVLGLVTAEQVEAVAALTADRFTTVTAYDALDRPTAIASFTATSTVDVPATADTVRLRYNEANLLDRVDVRLRGESDGGGPVWTPFVTDVEYDAKGHRTRIAYGNGARTDYRYDPDTFLLSELVTTRSAGAYPGDWAAPPTPPGGVQNLSYTHDPSGNITDVRDDAQQRVFFNNTVSDPHTAYVFDAAYRLVRATGREHVGQAAEPWTTRTDAPRTGLPHPHDGQAMRPYTETYTYDEAGNLTSLIHRASGGDWTRTFEHGHASLLDPAADGNRLSATVTGGRPPETYAYDPHGNLLSLLGLPTLGWDHADRLRKVVRDGGDTIWYAYDANGQRVRKVVERPDGSRSAERVYAGVLDVYREYAAATGAVTLERQTLQVMDDRRRIALVEQRTVGAGGGEPQRLLRYQFDNHLGSGCLELDDRARVISYEEFHPYGSTSYQGVRSGLEAPKRYRYTGKERDEETGFAYHGARYYAPWLGRWLSADPAGLADGVNVYAYGRGNPIVNSDPTGHLSWGQWAGIAAAVVVGTVVTVATAGLAGPVVGTVAAGIIGGIVGGAAGGAVGEIVEAKVDNRPVTAGNVLKAAAIGAVVGGVFAGAGAAAGAIAKSAFGKAVGSAIAGKVGSTVVGQTVAAIGKRIASSGAAKVAQKAHQAIREPAERLGQKISEKLGVGPGAKMALEAQERAAATQLNVQGAEGVTRETASAASGDTFNHSVGWRGTPLGPGVTGAQVEAGANLRVTPGGISGQWGEGAYAFGGELPAGSTGSQFQFKVPPQTAVEVITVPGSAKPIIRLVPPPGQTSVPISITGNNFPAGQLQQGAKLLPPKFYDPRSFFGYPGVSADVTGLVGGASGSLGVVAPDSDDKITPTPMVTVGTF
ncbi:SpvB/TcaC N-terminal domain-containing protein [Catellatospora sp. KI3]|uniref:SpvB/TcaC N-terminal domain-containing protein n=1 Tax=Catellatospora sp. KI3 TaxID=3041620 RepID=UPI002482CDD4|nr:SpvB/TcaC N-terminal domain-containing protein [Catellatospora sp. KI3]MDI1463143.1 SpvB/TcaC N-terminal domain-containing protein [Catellatospora sp. KI3]